MGTNLPDFNRAQYVESTPENQDAIEALAPVDKSAEHAAFIKALFYGLGAAIVCCFVYAAFTLITNIRIGYLAFGVGLVIAKAMMIASEGRGGRDYQIVAALLTYLAVSFAASVEALWDMHSQGEPIGGSSLLGITLLGPVSPFVELAQGFSGVLGLFILFIGIRSAWRIAAGTPATRNRGCNLPGSSCLQGRWRS